MVQRSRSTSRAPSPLGEKARVLAAAAPVAPDAKSRPAIPAFTAVVLGEWYGVTNSAEDDLTAIQTPRSTNETVGHS